MLGSPLQCVIHGAVEGKTGHNEQAHPPIEQEHRQRHDRCGENALRDEHDHAGGHAGEVIHRVGGHGGDGAEAVFAEIAHRQIAQMRGNLHAFVGGGAVAGIRLQGGGAVFEKRRANDGCQHDRKGKQDRLRSHAACQDRLQHHTDRRNFQRRKQSRQYAEDDGAIELFPLPIVTEMKELFQDLKHGRHLPPRCHGLQYARSKGLHTADRFAAAPSAFLLRRYGRRLPRRSGWRPRWWRAGGQ